MYSKTRQLSGNTSTPKRRCLGTSKVLRPALQVISNKTNITNYSDTSFNQIIDSSLERCGSPSLPCNQVEYLCDSGEASSVCSQIPCSPGILEGIDNWDSFVVPKDASCISKRSISKEIVDELDDLSDDMFQSKLELSKSQRNHVELKEMISKTEINFMNDVEKSFELVNQSICELRTDEDNRSSLFETKDSFLLDIRETGIMLENKNQNEVKNRNNQTDHKLDNNNTFYGLPLVTKNLFKSFRNIEKFYDWQEECLNLNAIKDHQNLIYALPTSGGKTLVAEVLMLREVLNSKKNALFILPFVAIVQEKIWAMSPFAVNLDFLVEEYAGGKGHIPPKKRRRKNSIYIATIEKGLALVRSLIELNRLQEIGLIVVDELHLIGEPGRGGTLETLLSTVIFANKGIQIVGMSATIGNLPEIAKFLQAEIFQRDFRPVELTEYVKLGDMLHKIVCGTEGVEVVPDRGLAYDYSAAATSLDPDWLGGLVSEVVPQDSCLVFCPTKRNCENVAQLLCKLQRREMTSHRTKEREDLEKALRSEGTNSDLCRCIRYGVAYHHAGLASDERILLEHAFRSGVISVICCTSTLAAGVNLPARRVIIRAPFVGREHLSLANYRQMVGRAGRAGLCQAGESVIICNEREWPRLRAIFQGGLSPAKSNLDSSAGSLILSAVALKLATDRARLRELLACTLLAVQRSDENVKKICDDCLRSHLQCGALEISSKGVHNPEDSHTSGAGSCYVYNDTVLAVSQLGNAAIKGCMELSVAKQLLNDLEVASKALVLMGSLHLLYLVTPHDGAGIRPDYSHYYSLYCDLDEEGVQTAKILGITEFNAIRMVTGKPITNVPESVLGRFYVALMLRDLWRQIPVPAVAYKYCVSRGTVQSVMTSSSSFASCAQRVCEELPSLWTFRALLSELASRLQHCAAPELSQLMELPAVKKARAMQLMRAGFKRIEDLAKASPDELVTSVDHLSRTAANHLISAARMMLIEKVENLRAEAEDVMDELKIS